MSQEKMSKEQILKMVGDFYDETIKNGREVVAFTIDMKYSDSTGDCISGLSRGFGNMELVGLYYTRLNDSHQKTSFPQVLMGFVNEMVSKSIPQDESVENDKVH